MIFIRYKKSVSSSKCQGRLRGSTITFSAWASGFLSVKGQPGPEDDHLLIRRRG